ncbi:MAG: hypothetical protein H0W68_13245 [Gemmatimonadaceae bacterium]|nr:hypothetical protein [Gemmatimonadaceae bacterium]
MFLLLALLASPSVSDSSLFIRVNQVGYLPNAPKVAVACALDSARVATDATFDVIDARGRPVLRAHRAERARGFGPCVVTFRLDFTSIRREGRYRIVSAGATSPEFRIGAHVYDGAADTLLYYLRQQRSGLESDFRRFRAPQGRHHRGLATRGRHGARERRVGRRIRLPPVRHDLGDRDVRAAHGVSRSSARVRRPVRGQRHERPKRTSRRAR